MSCYKLPSFYKYHQNAHKVIKYLKYPLSNRRFTMRQMPPNLDYLECFHNINKEQAEKLLYAQIEGTYIIRPNLNQNNEEDAGNADILYILTNVNCSNTHRTWFSHYAIRYNNCKFEVELNYDWKKKQYNKISVDRIEEFLQSYPQLIRPLSKNEITEELVQLGAAKWQRMADKQKIEEEKKKKFRAYLAANKVAMETGNDIFGLIDAINKGDLSRVQAMIETDADLYGDQEAPTNLAINHKCFPSSLDGPLMNPREIDPLVYAAVYKGDEKIFDAILKSLVKRNPNLDAASVAKLRAEAYEYFALNLRFQALAKIFSKYLPETSWITQKYKKSSGQMMTIGMHGGNIHQLSHISSTFKTSLIRPTPSLSDSVFQSIRGDVPAKNELPSIRDDMRKNNMWLVGDTLIIDTRVTDNIDRKLGYNMMIIGGDTLRIPVENSELKNKMKIMLAGLSLKFDRCSGAKWITIKLDDLRKNESLLLNNEELFQLLLNELSKEPVPLEPPSTTQMRM